MLPCLWQRKNLSAQWKLAHRSFGNSSILNTATLEKEPQDLL